MCETENSGENVEYMDSKHCRVYASAVAGLRQVFLNDSAVCDLPVHPSAAAGLRQDFLNDRIGEILLCEQNLTDPII